MRKPIDAFMLATLTALATAMLSSSLLFPPIYSIRRFVKGTKTHSISY
ncbi:hypothetical protein G9U52_21070 [Paenibacillus sp. S3N08]|uniref:Uncharacterized protein n=1 Tax=Paenibacillus agricola TaxID=2716264 RepID=A0ABX0JEN2_9BACL|nr:hypothetical protein [Paenibacillus agricola]